MTPRLNYALGALYDGLIRFVKLAPFFLPLAVGVFVLMAIPFLRDAVGALAFSLARFSPLWLPPVLAIIFFRLWVFYKRIQFFESQKKVLLEIRVPQNVDKSPLAMEIVLSALHQTVGESVLWDRVMIGKVRAYFSLEIASIEGNVKFFIWTRQSMKKFVETQIYSQYPSAEVHEAEDYIVHIPYATRDSNWSLFGTEWTLTKPDPYPIKTYIDYETNKDVFEEKKVDPITPLLE